MAPSVHKHGESREIIQWLEQALLKERESIEHRHQNMISDLSKQLSLAAVGTTDRSVSASTLNEGTVAKQHIIAGFAGDNGPAIVPDAEVLGSDLAPQTVSNRQSFKAASKKHHNGNKPVFVSRSFSHDGGGMSLYEKYVTLVNSPPFESVFAVVIVCSAIIMGVEMQYRGLETGHRVAYRSYTRPAAELWPWAVGFFAVAEWLLGILFTVELLMKLVAQRQQFFCDFWNWIDVLIVGSWLITTISESNSNFNPNILRLLRLMRLLRLLRLLGMISVFDSLYLMTTAIKGSLYILVWAVLVLCVVEMSIACLLQASVEKFLREQQGPPYAVEEVYRYFGSFARSMLTMFELTLGNWMPPTRALVENVSEWYLVFFLLHKFIIGFSVVSVITGVFIQETFKVATSDDQIMLNNKRRAMRDHERKMTNLFKHADHDGDGSLDLEEFSKIMDDPIVRKWLSSMGLEVDDVDRLFETLNGGDGKVTGSELVAGAGRLKGSARSIDLLTFITEYRHDRALIMQHFRQMDPEQFGNHNTTITGSEAHSASNLWCKVI